MLPNKLLTDARHIDSCLGRPDLSELGRHKSVRTIRVLYGMHDLRPTRAATLQLLSVRGPIVRHDSSPSRERTRAALCSEICAKRSDEPLLFMQAIQQLTPRSIDRLIYFAYILPYLPNSASIKTARLAKLSQFGGLWIYPIINTDLFPGLRMTPNISRCTSCGQFKVSCGQAIVTCETNRVFQS